MGTFTVTLAQHQQRPPKYAVCTYPGCAQRVRWLAVPQAYVHVEGINAHVEAGVPDHDAVVSTVESNALFDGGEVGGAR